MTPAPTPVLTSLTAGQPVRVGDLGIDSSGASIAAAAVLHGGGRFRIRYSAGMGNHSPGAQWKLCRPGEIAEAAAAGLDFVANSEWYESRITEGAVAGAADGAADLVFWRSRGLARGASVYVSWDQNPSRLKWGKVIAYLAAYDQALKGFYHVDCYAGSKFLAYALGKGVIRHGWRPNAGSWSGDGLPYQPRITPTLLGIARKKTPAAIWQTGNYWFGKQADENVVLRTPVGSHLDALAPPAPPATKPPVIDTNPPPPAPPVAGAPGHLQEDSMLVVTVDQAACARARIRWPGVFLLAGGRLTHLPTGGDVKALRRAGVAAATISPALYRNLGGK